MTSGEKYSIRVYLTQVLKTACPEGHLVLHDFSFSTELRIFCTRCTRSIAVDCPDTHTVGWRVQEFVKIHAARQCALDTGTDKSLTKASTISDLTKKYAHEIMAKDDTALAKKIADLQGPPPPPPEKPKEPDALELMALANAKALHMLNLTAAKKAKAEKEAADQLAAYAMKKKTLLDEIAELDKTLEKKKTPKALVIPTGRRFR